jgi:Zn-dependent protease with chaperone function
MNTASNDVARAWTQIERESFFAATARHRRASRRIEWAVGVCALALAGVVAVFVSPLCYALLGLLCDLANLLIPTPDLIGRATDAFATVVEDLAAVSLGRWIYLAGVAAIPGLLVMGLVMRVLGRIVREALSSDASSYAARSLDRSVLVEQQFGNVVEEMAIAAGIAAPRILVADSAAINAAAFGDASAGATMVATTGLLQELSRAQLQGIAAHVVGSVANGDLTAGARIAATFSLFGLVAKLSTSFADAAAARRFATLLRAAFRRGSSVADGELALALADPFDTPAENSNPVQLEPNKIPWRLVAWAPLLGPLVMSGFFGGIVSTFVLGPLISLTWRRRKYLADATAVRLTRDPEGLAGALARLNGSPVGGAFGAWIAHMSAVPSGAVGAKSLMGGTVVRMTPSIEKRRRALGLMGATFEATPAAARPVWQLPLLGVLALLVGSLMSIVLGLLLYVSAAISGLLTWGPAAIVNALLR